MAESQQITFVYNGRIYARDSACGPAYYRDSRGDFRYDHTLGVPESCTQQIPKIPEFDPANVRSFKITDAERNITMQFEQRPFKTTGNHPWQKNNERHKELFKNSYELHFGWRKADHDLFVNNMTIALRNTYNNIGPVCLWLRTKGQGDGAIAGVPEVLSVVRNKGAIDSEWRLQQVYNRYCLDIYEELCKQIKQITKWRVDNIFEGPNYLLRLAQAHRNAAVFSLGSVALEITQLGIDKVGLTSKLRAKLYTRANYEINNMGLRTVNTTLEGMSEVASDLMQGNEFDTNLGKMVVNSAFDKPYETVVNFSKEETTNMIMDYQTRNKMNPDLTVQDPISNPLIEKVIGMYAPAALAYNITKGGANTLLHSMEAYDLKKEAHQHIQFLIDEATRGLRQGKGYFVEINARRDAILKDLNEMKLKDGTFLSSLKDLNQLFLNDSRDPIEWWKSTPTGQTVSDWQISSKEESDKIDRKRRVKLDGEFYVSIGEEYDSFVGDVSEFVGKGVDKVGNGLESIGGALSEGLDSLDRLFGLN